MANTPAGSFYTERHIALKLMANTIAFEVTGKPEYRTAIDDIVRALRAAQLAPSDGGTVDGGSGVGSYMNSHALAEQSGGASLRFPHYFATRDGAGHSEYFNPDEDFEHSYDAATSVMWGAYFAKRAGNTAKMTSMKPCGEQLYTTFSHVVTHWTRPAAPANNSDAYRVNPAQKYNWWFKHSSAFPWLASTV